MLQNSDQGQNIELQSNFCKDQDLQFDHFDQEQQYQSNEQEQRVKHQQQQRHYKNPKQEKKYKRQRQNLSSNSKHQYRCKCCHLVAILRLQIEKIKNMANGIHQFASCGQQRFKQQKFTQRSNYSFQNSKQFLPNQITKVNQRKRKVISRKYYQKSQTKNTQNQYIQFNILNQTKNTKQQKNCPIDSQRLKQHKLSAQQKIDAVLSIKNAINNGWRTPEACKKLNIQDRCYRRWRKQFSELKKIAEEQQKYKIIQTE